MIELILPWPPSQNTYWRHIIVKGRSRTLISKKGRAYGHTCFGILANQFKTRPYLQLRLEVLVSLAAPKRYGKRRWDIDNYIKVIFDVMTHNRIWRDDSQVDTVTIMRDANFEEGYACIEIREI